MANQSPFVSPKEMQPITDAERRHSAMRAQYVTNDSDGLPIGQKGSRMQTLLPNIKRGGGGALKVIDQTSTMGLTLMGVEQLNSVPQYSDALTSID